MARPVTGSIRERNGNLEIRISIGTDPVTGKRLQRQETIPGTTEAAKRRAVTRRNSMIRQAEADRDAAAAETETLGVLFDRWLEVAGPTMSGNTLRTNRYNCDRYLAALSMTSVAAVTVQQIEAHYSALGSVGVPGGRPLAPDTIKRVHGTLRRALQYGLRWGWCATNAAALAEPVRIEKTDRDLPAPADVAAFLRLVEYEDPEFMLWLTLASATGARRGELCGLKWSDVGAGDLLIARAVVVGSDEQGKERVYVRPSTKTNKPRRIALGPRTAELLTAHRERCDLRAEACGVKLTGAGYVFAQEPDGAEPWLPQRVSKRYRRCRDRFADERMGDARVDLTGVRLGDLRHFVASQMLQAGEPAISVAARLGNSPRTLMANYAHYIPGADRESAQRMESLVTDYADTE